MIEIRALQCRKGRFCIDIPMLDTIDSPVTHIIGPSGSGKSTLLRVFAGFELFGAETLRLGTLEVPCRRMGTRISGLGYLSQDYGLWPNLSALQHLAIVRTAGKTIRPALEDRELLEKVGLIDVGQNKPGQLSEGQQQRLALARSLVSATRVLLLDEPFSNADMVVANQLSTLVAEICQMRNILRIQVVHDLRVIDKRDGVIVLVDGRVSEFGLWQSIFDNPSTEWLRRAVELL